MNEENHADAVIVAAGCGMRSGLNMPKQFFEVSGKPVLVYTAEKFIQSDEIANIAVVLPEENFEYWSSYIKEFLADNVIYVVGGKNRMHSVYNGLVALKQNGNSSIVCIHDGVRPFVTNDIIHNSIETAKKYGSALTAVPITDTVKYVNSGRVENTLDRSCLFAAQTPQTFDFNMIFNGYEKAFANNMEFTDDCGVAEYMGNSVYIVHGSRNNIKLTLPEDFERLK